MPTDDDDRIWVICGSAELAVCCLREGERLGLRVSTDVQTDWVGAAARALQTRPLVGAVGMSPGDRADLAKLATASAGGTHRCAVALLGGDRESAEVAAALGDLGLPVAAEVAPLMAVLALLGAGAAPPYALGARKLSALDRARLGPTLGSVGTDQGQLDSDDDGLLTFEREGAGRPVGEAPEVAVALRLLQRTEHAPQDVESSVDDVDEAAVTDVLFGPRRALSDPASKAVLAPYGVPLPEEEVCASPSRAAAEAMRIGFPVRIALASPDLRIWDHPELSVDMVDSAARVRDCYRSLSAMAERHGEETRVLGVTVTATSMAGALLWVRATPLPGGRIWARIGFADPHGWAAEDTTAVVLPGPVRRIERALGRLAGAALMRGGSSTQRRERTAAVGDLLLRLSALMRDRHAEIESVELRPVAIGLDGNLEVREACVSVSDRYERSLA